jgi:hypothetical protein
MFLVFRVETGAVLQVVAVAGAKVKEKFRTAVLEYCNWCVRWSVTRDTFEEFTAVRVVWNGFQVRVTIDVDASRITNYRYGNWFRTNQQPLAKQCSWNYANFIIQSMNTLSIPYEMPGNRKAL